MHEGGAAWALTAGYELLPVFAVELSYMHYPSARIYFDEMSLFSFYHHGLTVFDSHAETVALMGKYMFYIPHTNIRAFSSTGIAGLHRYDIIENGWRLTPIFGVGFNYKITRHIAGEMALNFIAGYGESELNPAEHYIPFLYSGLITFSYYI